MNDSLAVAVAVNLERAAVAGDAETVRRSHGVTRSTRSDGALRLARVALREGRAPTVRVARDAIAYCAFSAERYGDAGASAEAFRLAPFAVSRGA